MRILRTASVVFTIGVGVVGCIVDYCPDSERYVDGRCQPVLAEDAGVDAGETDALVADAPDAGPCGGACEGATPLCDETTGTCVACLENLQCTDVAASRCAAGACAPCESSIDCEHLASTPECAGGECVECTIATESERCGATSCDPALRACTGTPRGTVVRCGACRADSECRETDDRCVPMEFMGVAREGGYCLPRTGTPGCARPFSVPTVERASLSGADAAVYCGLDEMATTCEALRDLLDDTSCTTSDDCGVEGLADARCETVGVIPNRCTYSCGDAAQCPLGRSCGSGYCGSL